ncbi:protein of unknown function [Ruminococcaceae bacterium KH2T8]|nr:protein of unknown function [Ruminococcaceae bacterium KH2T8]
MNIPGDPVMLLSFVNTQLRDNYPSLDEFCSSFGVDRGEIEEKLRKIDYMYDKDNNRFV